jgi:SAM-dependent methyltransferase
MIIDTKKIPDEKIDSKYFIDIMAGSIQTKLLCSAIELKIFDLLSSPISAIRVSEQLNTNKRNTEIILDALTALNLIKKSKGLYYNTKKTDISLVSSSDRYLGEWYLYEVQHYSKPVENMLDLIKNGPQEIIEEENFSSETMCELFTISHLRSGLLGGSQQIAELVSELPEFNSFRTMLDLGGGPGINSIAILSKNLNLKGTVFDRNSIVKIAQNIINDYGMTERLAVMGGDYLNDPIGSGYDLILISDTLYYEQDRIERVIKKAYDVLNPNGVLFTIHGVLESDRTKPADLVILMLPDALASRGLIPTQDFLSDAIIKVGFKSVKIFNIMNVFNSMEVNIARK